MIYFYIPDYETAAKKKFFFTFNGSTVSLPLICTVSFSAKISPSAIGKNETAELRLMVENAGRWKRSIRLRSTTSSY